MSGSGPPLDRGEPVWARYAYEPVHEFHGDRGDPLPERGVTDFRGVRCAFTRKGPDGPYRLIPEDAERGVPVIAGGAFRLDAPAPEVMWLAGGLDPGADLAERLAEILERVLAGGATWAHWDAFARTRGQDPLIRRAQRDCLAAVEDRPDWLAALARGSDREILAGAAGRLRAGHRLASHDPAAIALWKEMRRFSLLGWRSAWQKDVEYDLWNAVDIGARGYGATSVGRGEIESLRGLAEACGGWVAWDSASAEARLIPRDAWERRYEKWRRTREASERPIETGVGAPAGGWWRSWRPDERRPRLRNAERITRELSGLARPDEPALRGRTFTARLRMTVGVDGEPRDVRLIAPSGDEPLDRAAVEIGGRMRFSPARVGGTDVAASLEIPLTLRVPG